MQLTDEHIYADAANRPEIQYCKWLVLNMSNCHRSPTEEQHRNCPQAIPRRMVEQHCIIPSGLCALNCIPILVRLSPSIGRFQAQTYMCVIYE